MMVNGSCREDIILLYQQRKEPNKIPLQNQEKNQNQKIKRKELVESLLEMGAALGTTPHSITIHGGGGIWERLQGRIYAC